MTKQLPISKWMVYNSYLKVVAKNGSEGLDGRSIEQLHENLPGNLNKIWNRMTSGNYFPPPVRNKTFSRKRGFKRPLGIPTVSDRIAQGVVKDYLEPSLEKIFHSCSFGYRPGRNVHDAMQQCQQNCMKYGWAVYVTIKEIFDDIPHDIMLQLLRQSTQEKWILLYAERWLKAGVQQDDGSIVERTKGIPKEQLISPLLANIYLHSCFDIWMQQNNSTSSFERYGDEIVIHCSTNEEAVRLLGRLKFRMQQYELGLEDGNTKIVHCKNYQQNSDDDNAGPAFFGDGSELSILKRRTGRRNRVTLFDNVKKSIQAKIGMLLLAR